MRRLGKSEDDGDDEPDDRDPRRQLAGIASAALHWTPRQFWSSTPAEFWSAVEAWKKMNTAKAD
ncbi:phage tail assembly chaperone [Sphingobium phenoxybenzoativorans]